MDSNQIIFVIILTIVIICIYLFLYKRESFEEMFSSCYEANDSNNCYTCDDVINAYKKKGYIYDEKDFEQCKK